MCQTTDVLRRLIGIYDYTPGQIPHARVRKPTRHGARGNGHAPPGLVVSTNPLIDALAREHRLIRQLLNEARRMRGRG